MFHWDGTLSCFISGLQLVRTLYLGHFECSLGQLPLYVPSNEVDHIMEHFRRRYSWVSSSSDRDHGSDWKHLQSGDCSSRYLYFLMAVPALLWHPL